jgi:hypothetical protein
MTRLRLPDLILLTIIVVLLWALFFQWSRNSYWFGI